MTVEIREIWVDGIRYSVEEAHALMAKLDGVLEAMKSLQAFPLHPRKPVTQVLVKAAVLEDDKEDFDKSEPDNGGKHCTTCGEDGHNKQTCTIEDNSRDYCCTMCGEPGHNRRTCPTRRIVHCSICGVEGHNKATCSVSLEDMVKEARAKLDEAEVTEALVEVKVAVPDPDFGGDHEYDVLAAMNDPALVSNFAGWNAYMKNPANHLRFVRGKRKGQLNLKRMGQQYRLLKYGSTNKRRYSTGRGVIKRVD